MSPVEYDTNYITNLLAYALRMSLYLSAPMLIAAVATGIAVSVFQAATQIQEQTLSFVPKIVATFLAVMFFGPWCSATISRFLISVLQSIPHLVFPATSSPGLIFLHLLGGR
ncbi:MAG TPA: flagellar biosynthesis protein FliQ [Candidatus Xenobia bacterium]|jgi:flagellar biosynthetic protein FliQ